VTINPIPPSPQPKRPRRLALVFALLALFQGGAAWRALRIPPQLAAVVSLSPAWEFVAGALWALAFALAAFMLWRGNPRAVFRSGFLLCVFIIYSVARLALLARADYDRQRLPALALAAAVVVGGTGVWLFWRARRHKSRVTEKFHGSRSEPERQD
jgi:uncharacterized membrane protein YsdA (DUF1294 family)